MLDKRIIQFSSSPHASIIVLLEKRMDHNTFLWLQSFRQTNH